MQTDLRRENGVALVLALMTLLLMTGLGAALVLTTASEIVIASNFRASMEALYAVDAAVERVIGDLRTTPDWNMVLSGGSRSAFVDGAPDGVRTLPDGSQIDLTRIGNMANCHQPGACSASDMDQISSARPWGPNNPRWQLYAYGLLSEMIPGAINSAFYVVAMVADDASETDNDPLVDGIDGANPGAGVLAVRAEAFGPRGAHRVVEATVSRQPAARLLSWREVR